MVAKNTTDISEGIQVRYGMSKPACSLRNYAIAADIFLLSAADIM